MPSSFKVSVHVNSTEFFLAAALVDGYYTRLLSLPQSFGLIRAVLEPSPVGFIPSTSISTFAEMSLYATNGSMDNGEFSNQSSLEVHGSDLWSSQENVVTESASHSANSVQPPLRRSRYLGRRCQLPSGDLLRRTRHSSDQISGYISSSCDINMVVLRRAFSSDKRAVKTREFWIGMHNVQMKWMQKVFMTSSQINAATRYISDCWKILTKVYSMSTVRPPLALQESIESYVRGTIKFTEFLLSRGCEEVFELLDNFINKVLRRYLRSCNMDASDRTWIQSREILRLVCQSPTNVCVMLAITTAFSEIRLSFLRTITSDHADQGNVGYAIGQIEDLLIRVNQRIKHCHGNGDLVLRI